MAATILKLEDDIRKRLFTLTNNAGLDTFIAELWNAPGGGYLLWKNCLEFDCYCSTNHCSALSEL